SGVDPAHLASADTQGHAVPGEHNGVGLHVLGDLPGEEQVIHLGFGRLQLGDDAELGVGHQEVVGILDQPAAAYALDVERVAAVAQRHLKDADVLLGGEYGHGLRRIFRCQDHFHELLADCFCRGNVNGTVEGDDAAEGG